MNHQHMNDVYGGVCVWVCVIYVCVLCAFLCVYVMYERYVGVCYYFVLCMCAAYVYVCCVCLHVLYV